jgi:hypothetical protein
MVRPHAIFSVLHVSHSQPGDKLQSALDMVLGWLCALCRKPSVTALPSGKFLIAGGLDGTTIRGDGVDVLEIFDPAAPQSPTTFVADERWMAGHHGKVGPGLTITGMRACVQANAHVRMCASSRAVFLSCTLSLPQPITPYQWVLPTGHVFMYSDAGSCIFNPSTGERCSCPQSGTL